MPKPFLPVTAVIPILLMAVMACTTATPTPSPTETPTPRAVAATPALPPDTPEPEATAAPAPSPEPTTTVISTAAPTATPVIQATPLAPGALAPLPLQDPQALLSSVSDAELDCIGEPDRLVGALAGLGTPAPEVLAELFACMEEETLTRLFLASFVQVTEPLSPQSSQCVRAAFEVIEPRKVMTDGLEGDAARAMAGSMAALTVTIACLNDEKWEAVGLEMGMRPEKRVGIQCLMTPALQTRNTTG